MMETELKWVITESKLKEVNKLLKDHTAKPSAPKPQEPKASEIRGGSGFDPLMVVEVSLSAALLIPIIADAIQQIMHTGGEIIDARNGKFDIYPSKKVKQGYILVYTDDGIQEFNPKDSQERKEIVAALNKLFGVKRNDA